VESLSTLQFTSASKVSKINQHSILPFRGINKGKTAIGLCAGPSLDKYVHKDVDERGDAVLVAGNNLVFKTGIPIDFLFLGVYGRGRPEGYDTSYYPNKKIIDKYRCKERKFFAKYRDQPDLGPPLPKREKKVGQYEVDTGASFTADVGNYAFGMRQGGTQMFAVLQFLLYTKPRRIILVGCDAANTGYSRRISFKKRGRQKFERLTHGWVQMKTFADMNYPEISLHVHNPIGLVDIGWNLSYGKSPFL